MTAHFPVSRPTSRMFTLALAGSLLAGSTLPAAALAAATLAAAPADTKSAAAQSAPAEPALTREDARRHAAEIFDRLDANHDGVLNDEDRKARRAARLSAMFDQLDTNHDGQISKAEFLARQDGPRHGPGMAGSGMSGPGMAPAGARFHGPMHPAQGPRDEAGRMAFSPRVFAILRRADPQHTGSVTKEAFIAAELQRFDEADTNHDGKVTREELRAARHLHRGWGEGEGWGHRGWGHRGWGHRRGTPGDMPPPPPAPAPSGTHP